MTQPSPAVPAQTKPAVLLLLSGGLDSTYLLHHYLTRTDLTVHAHHISIRYPRQPRWKAEGEAVRRIVEHCRSAHRPFGFSSSSFELGLSGDLGWDSDLQLLVASKVVPTIVAPRVTVALGWSVEDMETPAVVERAQRNVTPNLWRALWESLNDRSRIDPVLAMPLVEGRVRKEQMLRELPLPLARLTWSCRGRTLSEELPTRPCGQCRPCVFNLAAAERAGLGSEELPNLVAPAGNPPARS